MSDIPGKLVNAVFNRVLAPDLTPALKAQLKSNGLDLSAPLAEHYARSTWHRAIALTAEGIYPDKEPSKRLRDLGAHLIDALQSRGIVKGSWLTMARFMGPRRVLNQASDHLHYSPVKLHVEERGKNEFEIVVDDTEQADFLGGLLEAAISLLGGKEARVTLLGPRGSSNVFRATWR